MGAYQDYIIQSFPNKEVSQSYSVNSTSQSQEIAALTGLTHTANMVKSITFDNLTGPNDAFVAFDKSSAPTAATTDRRIPAGQIVVVENRRDNYFALVCGATKTATINVTIEVEGNTG